MHDSARDHIPDAAAPASTSLDPLESGGRCFRTTSEWGSPVASDPSTTIGNTPETLSESFRHSGWAGRRAMVFGAMARAGCTEARKNAFRHCGDASYVLRSKTDPSVYRIAGNFCHDRFCLPCGNSRARVLALNVADHVRKASCRFITLTIRADKEPLDVLITRLYAAFARLKRTDLWRRTQKGGVAFLEVKRNEKTQIWHPHFHVLAQGKYLDHALLRHVWHNITKDSHVVDVRAVKNPDEATRYVTKYASKPLDASLFASMDTLVEALESLQGRRMVIAFGTWRALKLTEAPTQEAWEYIESLQQLLSRAAAGGAEELRIVGIVLGSDAAFWIARAPPEALTVEPEPRRNPTIEAQLRITFA